METVRCLATGGAGFIGSHLVDTLSRHLHGEGHALHVNDAVQDCRADFPLVSPKVLLDSQDAPPFELMIGKYPENNLHDDHARNQEHQAVNAAPNLF
jgi:nucleoside-diphosphate-sugar epimerase